MRLKRGWRLADVAKALGVTPATISRVEVWEQLLAGKQWPSVTRKPERRPRGVLSRLAERFLADVKAGHKEREAGWRELKEIGLTASEVEALVPGIEY
ncbi:MAG TPA: helix-turn-helix domain-containing protein, partial [Candidatus Hypogeohydataceae bacterium YC38]